MAIQPVQLSFPESLGQRLIVARWDNLALGDFGEAITVGAYTDLGLQAFGTWGAGGTLRAMATNFGIAGNYNTCYDERGAISEIVSPGGFRSITDPVGWLKVYASAGDGTTLLSAVLVGRYIKRLRRRS